jgi:Rrf2 family transcriptional regulator, nitric oxide-sensitive transcriptional repressor
MIQSMFSQTTEYAVRAVVLLAQLSEKGPVGNKELAEKSDVPPSYLAKLMQNLVHAGIVASKRGVGGGFHLQKRPEEISILDVVNAVDPIKRIVGCPLGLKSHSKILCPMHARLDQAMAEVEAVLGRSTISELLSDSSRPMPMTETPRFLALPRSGEE